MHASWLSQLEIYFSIVQRKVLEPNDFANVADVARSTPSSAAGTTSPPFEWNFTRHDLAALIDGLTVHEPCEPF